MLQSHTILGRIAFSLLLFSTGLSAQRYTGHDHAVFHRQPQSPPVGAKHQSPSTINGATNRQKTVASASASSQQASRPAAAQNKLDVDLNHPSAPVKTETPLENAPRL